MPRTEREPKDNAIAVFGAGIAGLTTAHELARLGYRVSVYEADDIAGGFFRSDRSRRLGNLPTEYSWHGLGPWYHNTFDLLKQIPFDSRSSIYEAGLSRPIDFGIFPDEGDAAFYDRGLGSIPAMFGLSRWELAKATWLMLKTWLANHRTREHYSALNAAERWRPLLRPEAHVRWRSCFGPWIGSDWTRVSLHTAGQFFRKQLITRPTHHHPPDEEGPSWSQGAGDGWLLLRGPSQETWFDRWILDLQRHYVTFHWRSPLERLEYDGHRIRSARLASGESVEADHFVLATPPFAAAEILARTPELEAQEQLESFRPLIQDGPHIQVSFRIGFHEPIRFPRSRTAVVVANSEFNLTLFAQEQVWREEVELGDDIQSLWTGTSCAATVPGRLYGLPVTRCTKEQFLEEVTAQIADCEALDRLIREANDGRGLSDFPIAVFEVWHEWEFDPAGLRSPRPKWVTTTHTQPHQPEQVTPVPNLFVAGAHTRTEADVWSIEGAVESGRRAARGIDPRVKVLSQYRPIWIRAAARVDDLCFRMKLPHALDLLAWLLLALILIGVLALLL